MAAGDEVFGCLVLNGGPAVRKSKRVRNGEEMDYT
ncbi:uncharacterized protein G2W53_000536 [Senna tora]|uniref:Uncharacterized protein n=1 Tax=Senna tora TaxID=362788 RepID=A0A835CJJ8_9FABA|nr:uncharacterized protein G2W53_000536 [Senna tora]